MVIWKNKRLSTKDFLCSACDEHIIYKTQISPYLSPLEIWHSWLSHKSHVNFSIFLLLKICTATTFFPQIPGRHYGGLIKWLWTQYKYEHFCHISLSLNFITNWQIHCVLGAGGDDFCLHRCLSEFHSQIAYFQFLQEIFIVIRTSLPLLKCKSSVKKKANWNRFWLCKKHIM